MGMETAQTVVIRDRVYYGGGFADDDDDQYRVFCYSLSEDTWNTLPDHYVKRFGLGRVRGKLVTVGGMKKSDGKVTNEVYEFDEVTQSWKQSIPPMPTARQSLAVLSHHSTLTVAGEARVYISQNAHQLLKFSEKTPPSGTRLSHSHSPGVMPPHYSSTTGGTSSVGELRKRTIPTKQCVPTSTYFSRRPSLVTKHPLTGTVPTTQHGRFFPTPHTMHQSQPPSVHLSWRWEEPLLTNIHQTHKLQSTSTPPAPMYGSTSVICQPLDCGLLQQCCLQQNS